MTKMTKSQLIIASLAVACVSPVVPIEREKSDAGRYVGELFYPPEFLDREPLAQGVDPPRFVRHIVSPTLGSPRCLSDVAGPEPKPLRVFIDLSGLDAREEELRFHLVPRKSGDRLTHPPLAGFVDELGLDQGGTRDATVVARMWSKKGLPDESPDVIKQRCESFLDPANLGMMLANARWSHELYELPWRRDDSLPRGTMSPRDATRSIVAVELDVSGVPEDPRLYHLVLSRGDEVVDVQFNSVYVPQPCVGFQFVVAADIQWGTHERTVSGMRAFLEEVNERRDEIEFAVILGDLVDGRLGSARNWYEFLTRGRDDGDYERDYRQLWSLLLTLDVPIHLVPGNHDGIRFGGDEDFRTDGLLCFESSFGPLYHAFERGGFLFIFLNSYDLPSDFRLARVTSASNNRESAAGDKANVLNWGGGLQEQQFSWLERVLENAPDLTPVVFLHHDPRGSYPGAKEHPGDWATDRHRPLGWRPGSTPRSIQHAEYHAGHYTPLRHSESAIRSNEWFELGFFDLKPPRASGKAGWIRYQQGWHMAHAFKRSAKLEDAELERISALVEPMEILKLLVRKEVEYLFKGHDNRFLEVEIGVEIDPDSCCANAKLPDESNAERERRKGDLEGDLMDSSVGPRIIETTSVAHLTKSQLSELALTAPITIWHVADIGDTDTDGHGFLLVTADRCEAEHPILEADQEEL